MIINQASKPHCPNCSIELDLDYVCDWDPRGPIYKPYLMCGICSFGFPIDWREDDYLDEEEKTKDNSAANHLGA
jgi:hypothetical protein